MRRSHGGAEMPTRRDSSTFVMRPTYCSSLRIFQSIASSRSRMGVTAAPGGGPGGTLVIAPGGPRKRCKIGHPRLTDPCAEAGLQVGSRHAISSLG
jgi:hypothetical protein